jgi:hypothetical protein
MHGSEPVQADFHVQPPPVRHGEPEEVTPRAELSTSDLMNALYGDIKPSNRQRRVFWVILLLFGTLSLAGVLTLFFFLRGTPGPRAKLTWNIEDVAYYLRRQHPKLYWRSYLPDEERAFEGSAGAVVASTEPFEEQSGLTQPCVLVVDCKTPEKARQVALAFPAFMTHWLALSGLEGRTWGKFAIAGHPELVERFCKSLGK